MKNISEQSVRDHCGELVGVGSDWAVKKVEIDHEGRELRLWLEWKEERTLRCPECGKKCPGYDQMAERKWRHLDACGYLTALYARVPRSECKKHGVLAQRPSWAEAGSRFTLAFEGYAIEVLQNARSVSSACRLLRLDWESVQRIRERAVKRGLERRELEDLRYLGVDEKSFGRGHSYGTVVSDLEGKRVLEVVEKREEVSLRQADESLGQKALGEVEAVAMDLWRPYEKATEEALPEAKVVHDKFHVSAYIGEAVDRVRRNEHRELRQEGDETLNGSKYLWLMDPRNFTEEQTGRFEALLCANLKVGRAWSLKETFVKFWRSENKQEAEKFFRQWHGKVKRSRLKPLQEVAEKIKRHLGNILNYLTTSVTESPTPQRRD